MPATLEWILLLSLDMAQIRRCPGLVFHIQGALSYNSQTDVVTFANRAVLVVAVDLNALAANLAATTNDVASAEGDHEQEHDRSRSPRRAR